MRNLIDVEKELSALQSEKARLEQEYLDSKRRVEWLIKEAQLSKNLLMANFDLSKIDTAKKAMYIRGFWYADYNEAKAAILEAIQKVVSESEYLTKNYIGCKNYEGFVCQREDHKYGYGPRHGHIVFEIGYNSPKEVLTGEVAEACIYWLNLLLDKTYLKIEQEAERSRKS